MFSIELHCARAFGLNLYFLATLFSVEGDYYKERFETIYREKLWGVDENNEGYSGGGSELSNVLPYYEYLKNFIREHNIRSVVDLGCGDWTFSKWMDWTGIDYVGYDVVQSVIETNKMKYVHPNIRFVYGNFLTEEIPEADLMICKHVLQHIPSRDVFLFIKLLPKFKHSLILNAAPQGQENISYPIKSEFPFWEDRGVDITLPPFNVKGEIVLRYAQPSNASGKDLLIYVKHLLVE